ncbi:tetratricopeptide repeat protein [Streptomyces guryensis]|uniref:Tetratricopeptide repeat protein n=1 Tax=Streptomyces guryensis TaxID=2886947 RepID=A0A9Q3ZAV7_9ACTN|nr:tetratricopeptide repeat protein [Streptomyces guryensis]MCD9877992.1 tetratricopeptide repeat protein [Streptomyces guryensis]
MALNNKAACLGALGRLEDALPAINRAVEVREALAEANPDAFLPDLALGLYNQARCLAELGRREVALTANTRALTAYTELTKRWLNAFTTYSVTPASYKHTSERCQPDGLIQVRVTG